MEFDRRSPRGGLPCLPFPDQMAARLKAVAAVALDLDGTALRDDGSLSAVMVKALGRAAAEGLPPVFVSGRPIRSVLNLADQAGLDGPMIGAGGAVIAERGGRVLASVSIPQPALSRALEICSARAELTWHAYQGTAWFASRDDVHVEREIAMLGFRPDAILPAAAIASAEKILINGPDPALDRLEFELRGALDAVVIVKSKPQYLEFTAAGGSKEWGLRRCAELLGLTLEQLAALGDGPNDLEMLRIAGLPIAMGNAVAEVKRAAGFTIGTNQEDGAADFLEYLLELRRG